MNDMFKYHFKIRKINYATNELSRLLRNYDRFWSSRLGPSKSTLAKDT